MKLLLAPFLTTATAATIRGHGFIGLGIDMYSPTCATACRDTLKMYALRCSTFMDHHAKRHSDALMFETSPECSTTDSVFLQSLAFCIYEHCQDVPVSELEWWWEERVPGRERPQPRPEEAYSVLLREVLEAPPTGVADSAEILNGTTMVDKDTYQANYNGDFYFEGAETKHSTYGLIIFTTGFIVPVLLSLLRLVPLPASFRTYFSATFIDPPLFGDRLRRPIANLFHLPTRGQGLFILYLLGINIILCSVGYELSEPNAWFGTPTSELLAYLGNRTGVLSMANMPLLILYSSRNNFLLWVTNWSHATFLHLHRWVAAIATIQACIHSAIYLQIYDASGDHATESKLEYWVWGIVATLAMTILLPASVLPIRRKMYELFLASHFVLALFALVGTYLHIYYRFENQWGYENWLVYLAFPIWGADRLLRILRFARNGVQTAYITPIDDEYAKVVIPGVSSSGHAYLYFPSLSWRIWENHPFSVMGTLAQTETAPTVVQTTTGAEKNSIQSDQITPSESQTFDLPGQPSLTFLIRTETGITSLLRTRTSLPVLIESSYPSPSHDLDKTPNIVIIAGGVGVTAVSRLLRHDAQQRVRLYLAVRSRPLADVVEEMLDSRCVADICISSERRLDIVAVLEKEVVGETVVVVCGPAGMADDVRTVVTRLAREGRVVKLVDEAFSW